MQFLSKQSIWLLILNKWPTLWALNNKNATNFNLIENKGKIRRSVKTVQFKKFDIFCNSLVQIEAHCKCNSGQNNTFNSNYTVDRQ